MGVYRYLNEKLSSGLNFSKDLSLSTPIRSVVSNKGGGSSSPKLKSSGSSELIDGVDGAKLVYYMDGMESVVACVRKILSL